jgi:hypothetical protein
MISIKGLGLTPRHRDICGVWEDDKCDCDRKADKFVDRDGITAFQDALDILKKRNGGGMVTNGR